MIQTQNDKHPTLRRVVTHDYQGFYTREEANRKRLNYPPFTRICLIELKHKEEHRVKGAVIDLHAALKMYQQYAQIAPPCTAVIAKLRGEYRFQILLRTKREDDPSGSVLRKVVRGAYHAFREKSPHKDVPVYFDIDPQSVI
jgi:primosomal protein N' (replication factor Y)